MAYDFYALLDRMKYIRRWSLMRSSREENIMEHSQQVALFAHALAVIDTELFGGKPVCGGFAQAETIYTGTREEITAEVAKYLDEAGQVGVMLGADCTVPTDIDDERLEWVRQAAIQYAANPRVKL